MGCVYLIYRLLRFKVLLLFPFDQHSRDSLAKYAPFSVVLTVLVGAAVLGYSLSVASTYSPFSADVSNIDW